MPAPISNTTVTQAPAPQAIDRDSPEIGGCTGKDMAACSAFVVMIGGLGACIASCAVQWPTAAYFGLCGGGSVAMVGGGFCFDRFSPDEGPDPEDTVDYSDPSNYSA